MKTRKINQKDSTIYLIEHGSRTFKFVEYKEDVWLDKKDYPNQTKPLNKKGSTEFFILMDNMDLPFAMWANIKNVHNIKRAKEYVRNREYL